ncbi:hypothetical protein PPTG_01062 [Phytophthora nicotianae INRA-310]|uniref:DDE Tnp4 domain-containing protein n=1 Tax=Phytophthora nicotianae (strain INRA-310) TaxID=761204 RepID=W2RI51_PHYN3|nr:hypothetical protein PPTG_01062 [Phytophthora nicotianae INRA-310]ETN24891.1 hypothetical protein PPTG_01062 [Phytophthora nicotianae INRA-310]
MNDDGVVLILMLALAHEGKQEKGERQRGQHCHTRADLHPEPRYGTAWEAIYGAGNDRAFITTTGFDVRLILEDGAPHHTRNDVDASGESRPDRHSPSDAAALGLRYLAFSVQILLEVFKSIPVATISWPGTDDEDVFADYAGMISLRHPLLTKGFFFVDGVNIPVAESEFDDIQNAYYNGWTCSHYCSNVLAFAPDGSTIRATSIPSRLIHVQQATKLFLQRRKVSLRAIKLIHVVLVVVQHNLPFVCSSWENYTADL